MSAVLSLFLLGFILSYFWVSCITDLLSPLKFNFRLGKSLSCCAALFQMHLLLITMLLESL